jgi:hypothetical protein
MKHVLKIALQMSALACVLALASAYANGQDSSAQEPAPDNTKVNQRDRNKTEPTADQQKESARSRNRTQDPSVDCARHNSSAQRARWARVRANKAA